MIAMGTKRNLSGWGRVPVESCLLYNPASSVDAAALVAAYPDLLFRGAGRSYGDAALNPGGLAECTRLDSFLAFDTQHGIVRAEPGVSLQALLQVAVPRGWFLPVIPGTQHATLGGAIAANVHGKNHLQAGEIAAHVLELHLLLADGSRVACSAIENADLFWATAGGMGMTGAIVEATLQLIPLASAMMEVNYTAVDSLEAMLTQFEQAPPAEYRVGWIDHFASGNRLGRGIVESARHVVVEDGSRQHYRTPTTRLRVPFDMPSWTLNRYAMALYNQRRFAQAMAEPSRTIGFDHFFHPLDAIGQWNRLYGRRGFLQYQCLLPEAKYLRPMLEKLQQARQFSFLAVLKAHGPRRGAMSFSTTGYSLALDFPNTSKVRALLDDIDRDVIAAGGRVYLAKDARMSRLAFEAMYADALPEWKKLLKEIDPQRRFMSSMARRLGFKEFA